METLTFLPINEATPQAVPEIAMLPQQPVEVSELVLDTPVPDVSEAGQPEVMPQTGPSRLRSLGRTAATRAVAEVVGTAVDVSLIGVGSAGVGALRGIAQREVAASAADMAVLNRLQPKQVEAEAVIPTTRARKLGRGLLNFTLMAGTAYLAQKLGPELADRVNDNLNNGVGEIAVPLTSKVGAIAGVNSIRNRLGR